MNNNETILVEKLLFVYHTALKNIKYLFILIILSLSFYFLYIYKTTNYAHFYNFEITLDKSFISELHDLGSKINFCKSIENEDTYLVNCNSALFKDHHSAAYLKFDISYLEKKILNLVKKEILYFYDKNLLLDKTRNNLQYFNFLNSTLLDIGQNNFRLVIDIVKYQPNKDNYFSDLDKDMNIFVDKTIKNISKDLKNFYNSIEINSENFETQCQFYSKYLPGYVMFNNLDIHEYLKSILPTDQNPFDYIEERIQDKSPDFINYVSILNYIYTHFQTVIDCERFKTVKYPDVNYQISKIVDGKFINLKSSYSIKNKTKYFSIVLFIIFSVLIYLLFILFLELRNSYKKTND